MSDRFHHPTGPANPGPALFDGPPTNCQTCLHGGAYACNLLGSMRSEALAWRNTNTTGTGCPGWEAVRLTMLHGVQLDDPALYPVVRLAIDGLDTEAIVLAARQFSISEKQAAEVLRSILIQDGQRATGCFINAAGRLRLMGSLSEVRADLLPELARDVDADRCDASGDCDGCGDGDGYPQ